MDHPICPNCNGVGFVKYFNQEEGDLEIHECHFCYGTGELIESDTEEELSSK